jgi:hypothetical protein
LKQLDLFNKEASRKTLEEIKKERKEKERLEKMEMEEPYRYLFGKNTPLKTYMAFIRHLHWTNDESQLYGFYDLIMMIAGLITGDLTQLRRY